MKMSFLARKSHDCDGTAFIHGDSVGGSKLTEQTSTEFINSVFNRGRQSLTWTHKRN